MRANHASVIDLKPEKMGDFADYLKARLDTSVWSKECDSWYKNEAGKITNNWPDFTYIYQEATRHLDAADYSFTPAANNAMKEPAE